MNIILGNDSSSMFIAISYKSPYSIHLYYIYVYIVYVIKIYLYMYMNYICIYFSSDNHCFL